MRNRGPIIVGVFSLLLGAVEPGRGQQVVDRIAARVESDVILLSEVQELSRYQFLVDGKSESDSVLLDRLLDQWIVRNEARISLFPEPSERDVERSLQRLKRTFSSEEEFRERQRQSGLTDRDLLRILKLQLYLSNYLDTRFRPSIQVADQDVEEYYRSRVVPRAESGGQTPPTLEASREFIQEALVLRAINDQADRWLKESRSRLRVDKLLDGGSE